MSFRVVEKFVSINGEGPLSGQLSVFIRFAGCNLNCSFCDTTWANDENVNYTSLTTSQICDFILSTKINNITLTGGEPLIQKDISDLIQTLLSYNDLNIEIETNGSIPISKFQNDNNRLSFTMDYKLISSEMENMMLINNLEHLKSKDTIKFVCGDKNDLDRANYIIKKYNLIDKTRIYLSPVFGKIQLTEIVEFMKNNHLNGVTLQVQLHKIIWNPNERGV
jgi:7-carboxy-7-deazaguanine synthase